MNQRARKLLTMRKALHSWDDVDRLNVSRKGGGRGLTSIADCVDTSIQTWRLRTKVWRKTGYSQLKQYWQHEDQQNNNKQKTKMGRRTALWMFLATNK